MAPVSAPVKPETIDVEAIRPPEMVHFGNRDFLEAPELARLGAGLVARYDNFAHLREATITYLWKRKGGLKGGRPTLGKCQLPSGLLAHFAECDFVIWIAADNTREMEITAAQLEALVFHELCHAGREQDELGFGAFAVVTHDVEAFSFEIKHYGLWKEDLREMGAVVRQLRLGEAL